MNGFGAGARPLREVRHEDYEAPVIRDLGSLAEITADKGLLLDLTRSTVRLAAISNPLVPVDTGTPSGNNATVLPDASTGEVLGGTGSTDPSSATPGGGGGGSEPGGGSGGSGSSGGGGRLPFTGLALMGIAAVGAAAATAGAALRRALRRGDGTARDS